MNSVSRALFAAFGSVVAASTVGAYDGQPYPRDLTNTFVPVAFPWYYNDWYLPVSGNSADASLWSTGIAPPTATSNYFRLRIRAVGAPYTVNFTQTCSGRSLELLSSGATVRQHASQVQGREFIHLRHGRWIMEAGSGFNRVLSGSVIRVGCELIFDKPGGFIGNFDGPPVDAQITATGTLRVRAPEAFGASVSFSVGFAPLKNYGLIEISGLSGTQPVSVHADGGVFNYGEIRMVRGDVDSLRRLVAPRENEGLISVDGVAGQLWVGGNVSNLATMLNRGDIVVGEDATLEIGGLNARFELHAGMIEANGPVLFEYTPLIVRGGAVSGDVTVLDSILDLNGGDAPGTFRMAGYHGELRGVVGSNQSVELATFMYELDARVVWTSGFENDGLVDLGERPQFHLSAEGPLVNRGLLDAGRGYVEAPMINEGAIVLGEGARLGRFDLDHTLAGTIELEPGARASIFGDDTTLSADVIVRPTMPTLSPVGTYLLAISGDVTFDGARLIVAQSPNFTPHWGYAYNLLSFAAFDGWFDEVALPALPDPDWEWREEWFQRRYRVKVQHIANMNDDFYIDFQDVNAVVAALGQTSGQADIDESGLVDEADVAIVLSHFGKSAFPLP